MTRFDTDPNRPSAGECASRTAPLGKPEEWRAVVGYEGRYEVSSLGRIRSLPRQEMTKRGHATTVRGGMLTPMISSGGYLQVTLRKAGKMRTITLHRLVGLAFHGAGTALHNELAHLDGNPANPRADNLKWVSKVENRHHRRAHGTHNAGSNAWNAKLTEAQVAGIKADLTRGVETTSLARQHGVTFSCIESIRRGRNWRHVPAAEIFRVGPAAAWLLERANLARQLNEESKGDDHGRG